VPLATIGLNLVFALLLTFFGSAGLAADGGSAAQPFGVGLPDMAWQLLVDVPGFQMGPVQRFPGTARAFGTADARGMAISLTLAKSPDDPSARSCRDHDWAGRQNAQAAREDTRLSAQDGWARVDFLVPTSGGQPVREKHVLLYLQREGVCAVVHLSKLQYQPSDAPGLEKLLASVRLGG